MSWRPLLSVVALGLLLLPRTGLRAQDLPDDARKLVEELDQETGAIQKEADDKIKASTDKFIETLKGLQDKYTKEAKLDEAVAIRDKIRELKGRTVEPQADPGNLSGLADQVGKSFYFEVTGQNGGAVWGTDLYTTDSTLATAAVHAGAVGLGQKGVVRVTICKGEASYQGTTRNGVTTGSWGPYNTSFRVESAGRGRGVRTSAAVVQPDPGTLSALAGEVGKTFQFVVTGRATGYVWGTDVYTTDSSLAAAAVHAGALADGQSGNVLVTILPGQDSYQGSTRNGVTTNSWARYESSFRVTANK